jgi:hypothetical protein
MPTGDKDGDKMPNKWFSNRGQMIQAACAIIAVAIGIFTQRSSLTTSLDIEMVSKILFFPAAAVSLFQLGKYVQRLSTPSASPFPDDLPFDYRYLTPTIKVGSYHDLDRKLDTRRISVISIKEEEVLSSAKSGAEIEVVGTGMYFSGGDQTTKIKDRRFLLPAYARSLKSEDYSMFEFVYQDAYFTLTAISVDHINVPAQEVTLAVCVVSYRKPS